jgi:hypothetical protein
MTQSLSDLLFLLLSDFLTGLVLSFGIDFLLP